MPEASKVTQGKGKEELFSLPLDDDDVVNDDQANIRYCPRTKQMDYGFSSSFLFGFGP